MFNILIDIYFRESNDGSQMSSTLSNHLHLTRQNAFLLFQEALSMPLTQEGKNITPELFYITVISRFITKQ
jgi:hypothetical protein